MKKIMAVMLSLLACTVLLAGCNTSSESNEEQSLKVYSFSGENEYISVSNGVIILDGKDEICYGGDLKVMSDDFANITTYSTTIYINGSEKETLLSNGVDDQTGETIDVSGNVGQISGDILRDSDADKLTDNLWFELKTTNLNGEESTYRVQLETTEITKEVKNARGGSNSLGARLDKTDKSIARKLNSTPFDSEPKNNSPCYLTSGAVYNALLVKADKTALATKYDSSNIESGTSTLTPYSTVTDKIKSASCTYKTIGDIVIVSATVKMNAVSLGGNSMCPLIDLPYKCISEDNVFCVGISNLGKVFKFAVLKNNTWLQFQTQDKTAYTFADGEQINVICSYKIK